MSTKIVSEPLINIRSLSLCFVALIVNVLFLVGYKNSIIPIATLDVHSEVAYNICKHGSTKINPDRVSYIWTKHYAEEPVPDYADIDHTSFGPPTEYRNIKDTIGYGCLIAALWFINGSFRLIDMQIIQILMFVLCMLLFYQVALGLFRSRKIALLSGLALISFFPIINFNVEVRRDIWIFYGLIFLLFTVTRYIFQRGGLIQIFLCGVACAICQWMRPMPSSLFLAIVALLVILWGSVWFRMVPIKKMVLLTTLILIPNLFFYWIPIMTYNKIAYGRCVVGPVGQIFLEGAGDYRTGDKELSDMLMERYGLVQGTVEGDDKYMELFWDTVKERPFHWAGRILGRFAGMVFPYLPSNPNYESRMGALRKTFTSLGCFFKAVWVIVANIWTILFIMLGYLGVFLAIRDRRYFETFIVCSVIATIYSIILSHINSFYITPFYSLFSFFVAYSLFWLWKVLINRFSPK